MSKPMNLNISNEHKTQAAEYLEQLGSGEDPKYLDTGICCNLKLTLYNLGSSVSLNEIINYIAEVAATDWKYYSGVPSFPIRVYCRKPGWSYHNLNKWSKTSQYGKHRRELCLLVAAVLRAEVALALAPEGATQHETSN